MRNKDREECSGATADSALAGSCAARLRGGEHLPSLSPSLWPPTYSLFLHICNMEGEVDTTTLPLLDEEEQGEAAAGGGPSLPPPLNRVVCWGRQWAVATARAGMSGRHPRICQQELEQCCPPFFRAAGEWTSQHVISLQQAEEEGVTDECTITELLSSHGGQVRLLPTPLILPTRRPMST